ncbi:hypothetical protein T06_5849 [Trichinella sp. T6]|nr:hypothetical protein T06_5849 [Trichinella sp. T6]
MLLKLPQHPGQEFGLEQFGHKKLDTVTVRSSLNSKLGSGKEGKIFSVEPDLDSVQRFIFKDKRNVRAILIASSVISGSDFSTRLLLSYVKLKQSYAQTDQFDCSILVTESTFPLTS